MFTNDRQARALVPAESERVVGCVARRRNDGMSRVARARR